jgi:hypothetical protein
MEELVQKTNKIRSFCVKGVVGSSKIRSSIQIPLLRKSEIQKLQEV